MTTWSSSRLRYLTDHCPQSLAWSVEGRWRDPTIFAAGKAAHAVLQALTDITSGPPPFGGTVTYPEKVADAVVKRITTEGSTYRGSHEPPIPIEAAIEGRDLALRWWAEHRPEPGARAEVELVTRDGRYAGIVDCLSFHDESDEEADCRVMEVTEYKSAWPTDESQLDSLQSRGHAVLMFDNQDKDPEWVRAVTLGEKDYRGINVLRRTVVNLRTMQSWTRDLYPEDADDAALIESYRRDIALLCDAADAALEKPEAAPGAGCMRCPYVERCNAAKLKRLAPLTFETSAKELAVAYSATKADMDRVTAYAKAAITEGHVEVPGGQVGYRWKPGQSARDDAYATLADAWGVEDPAARGLLAAMPIGVAQVTKAAKALYPDRDDREAREALIDACTEPGGRKEFGVWKGPAPDVPA